MKNKKILILSGSVFLLFAILLGCGERTGEKEYNKALASIKNGDLVRAEGQLEKAIRKFTSHEEKSKANNQLGIILWQLEKQKRATEAFAESCRLSDDLTGANKNLAIALFYIGALEQSEFEFTKIINEQPENMTAHTFLSFIQMQQKDWKNASKKITEGLRSNPNNPAGENVLALTELHLNQSSNAAIQRLTQLIATHPNYAPAMFNLAVINDQWLKNKVAATHWYNEYLAKAGNNRTQTAIAKQAISRLGGKQLQAKPTVRIYPEAATLFIAKGSTFHAEKKYKEALTQYEKAIRADPSQKTAYYNMGLSYYALGKYLETATACTNALKIDPHFADARYMLALAYSQQQKWSKAEREAKILKQIDSERGASLLKYISESQKK